MTADALGGRRLRVEADLHLELGGRPATLTASGSGLILQLTDTAHTLDEVRAVLPRPARTSLRDLGRVADALHTAGLRLTVRGERGTLVVLGERGRWPMRLLTGSAQIRPGRTRALVSAVLAVSVRRGRR